MNSFSIVKKIHKGHILTRIIIAVVLLFIAVLFALLALPKTTKYFLAGKNVFGSATDNYKEDRFYKGKALYLYDWFAENDKGKFYLAPAYNEAGEDRYLIVYIPDDYEEKADRLIEQTINYLKSGDESYIQESIKCRGFIDVPNPTTIEYARQYFDLLGAPNEKAKICEYMFVMVPLKDVLLSGSSVYIVIIIALIIGASASIITAFTKGYLKNLKNRLAREGMTLDDLDAEFAQPVSHIGNYYVSSKHVMNAEANPRMLKIEDVIWIHSNKMNSINSNQTLFNAVFYMRYHECVKYQMKTIQDAELLCQTVHSMQPRALFGYVIENSEMYYKHFNELVDQVYNQKEENAEEQNAEASSDTPDVSSEAPVSEAPAQPVSADILTPSSVAPKEEEDV